MLEHWCQLEATGRFAMFDYGGEEANREVYGAVAAPAYQLSELDCPCCVIHGGLDDLVDAPKLLRALPNVVFEKLVPHHEHMDSLLAEDAHDEVFVELKWQLGKHYCSWQMALENASRANQESGLF